LTLYTILGAPLFVSGPGQAVGYETTDAGAVVGALGCDGWMLAPL